MSRPYKVSCRECGEPVHPKRAALGYGLCLDCGEEAARRTPRCVVPMHKSNYVLVTNYSELKYINPKRQPD
jgi:ribosomal protein L37AE/L43A